MHKARPNSDPINSIGLEVLVYKNPTYLSQSRMRVNSHIDSLENPAQPHDS